MGVPVMTPALSWISSVPPAGGMTWPTRQSSETSSSMDSPPVVKVSARIEACSDRTTAGRWVSVLES
jgi:hypothetical protein